MDYERRDQSLKTDEDLAGRGAGGGGTGGPAQRNAVEAKRTDRRSQETEESRQETEESRQERLNRELLELLQGLRVAVTGVQVLFAFLLTIPYATGFVKVDDSGQWLYFIALLGAALASICFITPAAQHRVLFRTGSKDLLLRRANRLSIAGAFFLAVAMTSAVALVTKSILSGWPAAAFGALVAVAAGWFWLIEPAIAKRSPDAKLLEDRLGSAG
ncbi:DUF6328 family protein [Sinosporangium siamense]|uniref:Uncharacterized protein n=1 Tax=Sinosporangium siamense TaxID=1367973 RepID=A0A919RI24_9ACTN|nr:DUF6328 family protein [Sinosporangium siamense]GII92774.1 hypothetical protein Ssi02_30050 [Sinosporangium siamense]